ncbi:extracellular solute-binding protein [Paenibacillus agaridevorans]|uniref:extracellular solute-binding protein n=1 Tax=Paenibacillus agaridevorans TaxID=171404 RepID=UPI001BE45C90|nr:extracellular solute-binding protein [Paenibacillus agaridevorans]
MTEWYKSKSMMVALSAVALTATLAACSSGTENGGKPNEEGQPATSGTEGNNGSSGDHASYYFEEPQTISMFTEVAASWPYKKEWPAWNWIKEKTNIAVDVQIPSGSYEDTLALNIASGEVQDVLYMFNTDKYGEEGVLLDLAQHLDKMPNFKKFLDDNPNIKTRATNSNGNIYSAIIDGAGVTNQMIWFYRDDIFAKHDLQPPTTWDELYEVSKKLKELYPDSYPFIFRHGLGNLSNFATTFNTTNQFFPDPETSEYRYGPIEDNYKEMLTYLNKFYEEKLFPPDWLSMDVKVWNQAITTGKSFITVQYIPQMEIVNNQLREGEHMSFMAPPAGVAGSSYIPSTNMESNSFAVYAKTKNLDASLQYIDFLYSEEGSDIMSWGKENETYTVADGKRTFLPEYKQFADLRREAGIMTHGTYGKFDTNAYLSMIADDEKYAYEEAPKYAFPVQVVSPRFNGDVLERVNLLNPQISKHYEESMARFIMGNRPLSEWSSYTEEMNKLGVPEMLEIYQQTWDDQRSGSGQ